MKKKLAAILSLTFVLSLLLSSGLITAQDTVTIDWWHISTNTNERAFWDKVAADYMAANPNVEIELTVLENEAFKARLVTVMQAGEPPDLFQSWGGGVLWAFAEAGLLRDITPELEANDSEWKNSFTAQAALNLFSKDGAYYGVPWSWGAVGLFYNKALFAEAGLDPENPPATWEEFLAAVQQLKDAGITPITVGELEKWPGHFWWVYLAIRLGGEEAFLAAYNREGAFTDEPFVQAGEYLNQLIALDPFQEGHLAMGYGDAAAVLGRGEAAMHLMGQWDPGTQQFFCDCEGIGEDLGWFPFPAVPEGAGAPDDVLGGGDGFAVGKDAPDETVDFLRYITSVDVQSAGAEIWIVPVVEGAESVVTDDPVMNSIIQARNTAPYFQLYYDQFLPPAVGQTVNDAVEGLFTEAGSPEDVAALIEDAASLEMD
ncbi:MAG: extracellular solute-binding protein [Anaerolineae bacterium]|nr:extracellular solute-binding protein [Anaerolineae bacterium]